MRLLSAEGDQFSAVTWHSISLRAVKTQNQFPAWQVSGQPAPQSIPPSLPF
jgi:hypothetical protein